MATASATLPLSETVTPASQAELAATICEAYESSTPMYPLGGGTSLDYGLASRSQGLGISMAGLNRVVDYPARDMTITVEAGLTLASLSATLAAERQRLAVDVAQPGLATVGGLVATNFNGPRRFGHGTVRDYVIGISAVDGRGTPFKGGGRVVKNVAGYDFCKLLTGSLGTLAAITQVTFKLKPLPESTGFVTCQLADGAQAERLLAGLTDSRTTPVAVELLAGPDWQAENELQVSGDGLRLLVGFEGTKVEVDWMLEQLADEWQALGQSAFQTLGSDAAERIWSRLAEFGAGGAPLVLRAAIRPSEVSGFVDRFRQVAPKCSLQAHACSGVVVARLPGFSAADASGALIRQLQPAAVAAGGRIWAWAGSAIAELTRQAAWGGAADEAPWMRAVKQQFDPRGLLNPGRFVYT